MVCCINVACFFCTLCVFIGLASLIQFCLGIYLTFIQTDVVIINRLVKTDEFDSYLFYILLVFIGLGFISLALSFFSIYTTVQRLKSLSLFISVLWVRSFFCFNRLNSLFFIHRYLRWHLISLCLLYHYSITLLFSHNYVLYLYVHFNKHHYQHQIYLIIFN
jgi:hypothetical protein